ncbi:Uncharacterised protein [Serratia plymuthica]|uniref:Uncharacterized protein n=1 Tax=Serratia plymuthica TaxID=82996 RepID=A0A2X4VC84_SERPL|nr:Uncharacterised protein [Serratia plymuthica]
MHQPGGGVALTHTLEQLGGTQALGWPQSVGIPFIAVRIVDGDERRLAAHRQMNAVGLQIAVNPIAERVDGLPLFLAVGFGHTRHFVHAGNGHQVLKFAFALINRTADRGGTGSSGVQASGM